MILDEESFVDLYEVLEMGSQSDAASLRRRISVLYLQARENLDHQNHRKRFYYRELHEVHLPNARLIFLDPQKRAQYDEQLQHFRAKTGKPERKPTTAHSAAPKSVETVDPFAEFADLEDDIPLPPIVSKLRMNPKDVERRRDVKRRELIKHEIIANGFKWGFAGGLAVLLVTAFLILLLQALLPNGIVGTLKISAATFIGICAVFIMACAAITARQTMRWARQRTVGYLSKLPYDELLRRCAG